MLNIKQKIAVGAATVASFSGAVEAYSQVQAGGKQPEQKAEQKSSEKNSGAYQLDLHGLTGEDLGMDLSKPLNNQEMVELAKKLSVVSEQAAKDKQFSKYVSIALYGVVTFYLLRTLSRYRSEMNLLGWAGPSKKKRQQALAQGKETILVGKKLTEDPRVRLCLFYVNAGLEQMNTLTHLSSKGSKLEKAQRALEGLAGTLRSLKVRPLDPNKSELTEIGSEKKALADREKNFSDHLKAELKKELKEADLENRESALQAKAATKKAISAEKALEAKRKALSEESKSLTEEKRRYRASEMELSSRESETERLKLQLEQKDARLSGKEAELKKREVALTELEELFSLHEDQFLEWIVKNPVEALGVISKVSEELGLEKKESETD